MLNFYLSWDNEKFLEELDLEPEQPKLKPKRIPWNKGLTKETCPTLAAAEQKKVQTNLNKYGVANVFQSQQVQDKLSDARHSGELAAKAQETKAARYGDKNYNNSEQSKQTKLDRYGDPNYNNREKASQTSLQVYGTAHPNQNPEQAQKISQTRLANHSQEKANQTIISKYGSMDAYFQSIYQKMKEHGTLGNHESQLEKQMYQELCAKYGEENIKHPYFDAERYPFKCDFYIIPEDKFIELHGHFTHGPHPFDKNNPEDLELLDKLTQIDKPWAKSFIYTWTNLDVRKLETAKQHNLNFKAIYPDK